MKKILLMLIILSGCQNQSNQDSSEMKYMCDKDFKFYITFLSESDSALFKADQRSTRLTPSVSASGAKYEGKNKFEKIIFWGKGETAFVEINKTEYICKRI